MNAQDYIANRLARIRDDMPDPICYPIAHERLQAQRAELEAMQAHLSQSTRPESSGGSIGGQYLVCSGRTGSYLLDSDGFTRAWGLRDDLQKLASDLNQLEVFRASHGELVEALTWLHNHALPQQIVQEITEPLLTKAQSLICPTKTPTAAPQG